MAQGVGIFVGVSGNVIGLVNGPRQCLRPVVAIDAGHSLMALLGKVVAVGVGYQYVTLVLTLMDNGDMFIFVVGVVGQTRNPRHKYYR